MPQEACERAYPHQITRNMVCAGDPTHGEDACEVRRLGHRNRDQERDSDQGHTEIKRQNTESGRAESQADWERRTQR